MSVQQVIDLELALLTAHVRQSRARVDELLDPDFTEIGGSGRLWTRPEILDLLAGELDDVVTAATDVTALQLTPDLVLLTYLSIRAGRRARRCSLWRRSPPAGWRLLFHQGTPLAS